MDLHTYLLPKSANQLEINSTEKALASLSLRRIWHAVFDLCPNLLSQFQTDNKIMFDAFLLWADKHRLSMKWSLHVHLLRWLSENSLWKMKITLVHKKELLVASALRWAFAVTEDVDAKGLIIVSPILENLAVRVWRSEQLSESPRFHLLKISPAHFPVTCCYALLMKNKLEYPVWMQLPK